MFTTPRNPTAWSRLALVGVLLCTPFLLLAIPGRTSEEPAFAHDDPKDGSWVMGRLTKGLRRLDLGLSEERSEPSREGLAQLESALDHVEGVDPFPESERFRSHASRLAELVGEIEDHVGEGSYRRAVQTRDELVRTCVTCHVDFRPRNELRGRYPARQNVVHGTVEAATGAGFAAGVLVSLETDREHPPWPDERVSPSVEVRESCLDAELRPLMKGGEVHFVNVGEKGHELFSLSQACSFDLGVLEGGESRSVTLRRSGSVRVYCRTHPEAQATLLVLDNPYYALTDDGGRFVLTDVPDGAYRLRVRALPEGDATRIVELSGGSWWKLDVRLLEEASTRQLD